MRKKRVLVHSDFVLLKTGFAKNAKLVLSYLYKTGKYELAQLACGTNKSNPAFKSLPWKTYGTLPDSQEEIARLKHDQKMMNHVNYGNFVLDKVIEDFKPDVYLGVQDIWGVAFASDKDWFNKISSCIWTTLDSKPILPMALEKADKIKNYWIWADFATKEMHRLGHKHVETVRGCLNDEDFFKFDDNYRLGLRQAFNIEKDAYVVGFVFRNQLRKSVPNLLKGFKIFCDSKKDDRKKYLLLHTNFQEGWNILKLAEEHGIDKKQILTTYICSECNSYFIKDYSGEENSCGVCGAEKSVNTTAINCGVSEEQLNEVYNLMDVYCHPFTSGGQEIPIQEAKLCELVTLVTDYSCGEDMCVPEAHSYALDWHEYREHGTEFIKASTDHESIAKNLSKAYELSDEKKKEYGVLGRNWVIENFSVKNIGKRIEKFLDDSPNLEEDFVVKKDKNPEAEIDNELSDKEWIKSLYKKILSIEAKDEDDGFKHWIKELEKGGSREGILAKFRSVARGDKEEQNTLKDYLDEDDEGKRILYVIPERAGDIYMSTSLFKNIKLNYPEHNLYVSVKSQYSDILHGNPYVHKVIPFFKECENTLLMEGKGDHQGFFDILFLSHLMAQKHLNYLHNGNDKIMFDMKTF